MPSDNLPTTEYVYATYLDIDKLVRQFAQFLNSNWNSVFPLLNDEAEPYAIEDWMQANWEQLVERKAGDFLLDVYGAGSDSYGATSRITMQDKAPTHRVVVVVEPQTTNLLTGCIVNAERFLFDEFVSFKNGWYETEPEFDCVLAYDRAHNQCVFSMLNCKFQLEEMETEQAVVPPAILPRKNRFGKFGLYVEKHRYQLLTIILLILVLQHLTTKGYDATVGKMLIMCILLALVSVLTKQR